MGALGILAKIQILVGDSTGIKVTGQAAANGGFKASEVPPGAWCVGGWLDANANATLDDGDYHGEYPGTVAFTAGKTVANLNFDLTRYSESLSGTAKMKVAGPIR